MKRLSIFYYLLCVVMFIACGKDPDTAIPAKGFLEYQYSYTVDGETDAEGNPVFRFAYKRVVIDEAFFTVNDNLPESLASKGFRRVDCYVRSGGYTGENVTSLGGSYVKIQLVDTLGFDADQDKLLAHAYNASELSILEMASRPLPVHLGFEGKMSLKEDAVNGGFAFEENITGQERITLLNLGNKQYEIVANGICNERTYNFHYVGQIHLGK